MAKIEKRISTILEVANSWLHKENHYLADAIDRTVQEGYFSFGDVQYAIQAIKESISREALEKWVDQSDLAGESATNKQNVLCLHAGNLPLVGFQDAFATLLSGARYSGKISRKDPYLLPTFLNEVKKTGLWSDMDVQWTHRLDDFEDMRHDRIIFAGSESSVPDVKKEIQRLNLAKKDAQFLIRTAHFSMAYINEKDEQTIQEVTESILRYGGKGCRSVAIVVSPFTLNELKTDLKNAIRSFWLENPQHQKPPSKLKQQYAYNEAVERSQLWLDYFLLQEGGLELNQDFVCYWVKGGESTVAALADQYGEQLQSIYSSDPDVPSHENKIEKLTTVQRPPISWKPDGVDTLEWLIKSD